MNDISKNILMNYQSRRTKKQKQKFIKYYTNSLSKHNIPYHIEENGILNHRNIIIGDLNNSEIIITAHYDTAPIRILPIPNVLVFPNKTFLSIFIEVLYLLLFLILSTLLGLIFGFQLTEIVKIYPILLLLTVISGYIGPTNHHTANDNTSGVVGINEIIFDLEKELDGVAFVLFDNEEKGLLGSGAFSKKYKKELKDKFIINLDCISDGDYIMVMPDKKLKMNKNLQSLLELSFSEAPEEKNLSIEELAYFPSDQINFENSIVIAAFNNSPIIGKYLSRIHTNKDIVFDQKNIEYIKKSLINLIDEAHNIKLVETQKESKILSKLLLSRKQIVWVLFILLSAGIGFFLALLLP